MHTIPQNVTSYEDKIVGQFVGRQFIYLAVGGMIDFLLLTTQAIPLMIRFTIAAAVGSFAAAMALLKLQDRGFDVWVFAFLRAVLGPTEYTWQKQAVPAAALLPDAASNSPLNQPQNTPAAPEQPKLAPRERVNQFEDFLSKGHNDLDEHEQSFLSNLDYGVLPPQSVYGPGGPTPAMLTPNNPTPAKAPAPPQQPNIPVPSNKPVANLAQSTNDPRLSFSVDGREESINLHRNQEVSRSLSRQLLSGGLMPLPVRGELHLSLSQGLKQELSNLIGFEPTEEINKTEPTTPTPLPSPAGSTPVVNQPAQDHVTAANPVANPPSQQPIPPQPVVPSPPTIPQEKAVSSAPATPVTPPPLPSDSSVATHPTQLGSTFKIPHKPLQLVTEITPASQPQADTHPLAAEAVPAQKQAPSGPQLHQDELGQAEHERLVKEEAERRLVAEEAARIALEKTRVEEEARRAAEEAKRQAEEAEQERLRHEQELERQRIEDEKRKAEQERLDEEKRQQELEELKKNEEARLAQIEADMRAKAQEEIERVRIEAEKQAQEKLEEERKQKEAELQSVRKEYDQEMAEMQEHAVEVEAQSKEAEEQLHRMQEEIKELQEKSENAEQSSDEIKEESSAPSVPLPEEETAALEPLVPLPMEAEAQSEQPAPAAPEVRPEVEIHTDDNTEKATEEPATPTVVSETETKPEVRQPTYDGSGINNEQTLPTSDRIRKLAEEVRNTPKPEVVEAQILNDEHMLALTDQPNVINGVVFDRDNQFLAGVVVVIKDNNDEPKRALKTNKLGQFVITTPLPDGSYKVEVEKKGTTFDIMKVDLNGSLLPPLRIQGR